MYDFLKFFYKSEGLLSINETKRDSHQLGAYG
jgi:hypothetical protein